MIVIRRMVDRRRAYTAIFLKGEPPKIFPTTDAEHARILQVYKQDRPHEGILNDFAETDFPAHSTSSTNSAHATPHAAPAPWPLGKKTRQSSPNNQVLVTPRPRKKSASRKKPSPPPAAPAPLWLVLTASRNA